MRGILGEVVEELAHHRPAEEEGGAGVEGGRHQGESQILHEIFFNILTLLKTMI